MDRFARAAHYLMNLRKTHAKVETLPTLFRPNSPADAFEIQEIVVDILRAEADAAIVGYKVATTSQAAQQMLNVDGPFSGQLLSSLMHSSGVELAHADYTTPIAEPEFAFRVASDVPLSETAYTAETIAPYLGDLMPAIEIVDHRYFDLGTAGGHCIHADNAILGCAVLGEPIANWRDIDLATHPVAFRVNDDLLDTGVGGNALGHPLNVMAWLANDLATYGRQLLADQVVLTGTVTGIRFAEVGDEIEADFGRFGRVGLSFV